MHYLMVKGSKAHLRKKKGIGLESTFSSRRGLENTLGKR